MSLINREDLIAEYDRVHVGAPGGARKLMVDAPEVKPEPKWIPVSERLPDVRQWVLCQCRAGIMDVLRLTEDGSWNKNYPHTVYMGGFVTAWMPLPEPWKGEQDA